MSRRPPITSHISAIAAALFLSGCNWTQSALAPRGSNAETIDRLTWLFFIGGTLIALLVFAFLTAALLLRRNFTSWMTGNNFIIGFGIVFPVVTLTSLLAYSSVTSRTLAPPGEPTVRVEVIGEQFWWRVNYLDPNGEKIFETANEIRIPVGAPVEFILKAQDVIHSFWVPSLAGKLDMIPGRVNTYKFSALTPGTYRGQCAEYCGAQHALMAFYVIATSPAEFEAWARRQASDVAEPATPFLASGREVFISAGCGSCHTVRGTAANGVLGPDLTHIGSRISLAAGSFPLNRGTLAGWTASAQHLKPGNLMPSFGNLSGEQLRAIAAYMESLE